MSLLSVQDLRVRFHDHSAGEEPVSCFSVEVEPGEVVGIVGESGSGKSTAMLAILGLLPGHAQVTAKQVLLAGHDIAAPALDSREKKSIGRWRAYERRMETIRGNEIAFVFQDPMTYLNPTVTIGRQLAEAIRAHRPGRRAEVKKRSLELLELVGIRHKERRLKQYPFELSGGIRQRMVIAIALACEPKLIIADEPTTALDATVRQQILELFKKLVRETKTAVLLVSHDLGVIASMADKICVMKKGMIVESGTPEQIFDYPQTEYTQDLVRQARDGQKMQQREQGTRTLLEVQNLAKSYDFHMFGRKTAVTEAVSDVSFSIRAGETFGLVGESGCGKTTLAGLIMGIEKPDSGTVYYRGKSFLQLPADEKKAHRKRVQMVFQDPYASLDPKCTIGEILAEPLQVNKIGTRASQTDKVKEILHLVGLSADDARKYPHAFSGGQRQRIGIARALILEPELLVCDEPVSSLDLSIQHQILELLERIQRERAISCLFISHDLHVVKQISHQIGVMYAGRLIEIGDTQEVYEQPLHPYTRTLLAAVLTPQLGQRKTESKIFLPVGRQHLKGTAHACPFAGRCRESIARCYREKPGDYQMGTRRVSCFLYRHS